LSNRKGDDAESEIRDWD